jgi:hypothetical protein
MKRAIDIQRAGGAGFRRRLLAIAERAGMTEEVAHFPGGFDQRIEFHGEWLRRAARRDGTAAEVRNLSSGRSVRATLPAAVRTTLAAQPGVRSVDIRGDRVFIQQDHMIALDSWVGKMLNPFERIFGTSLLGMQMVQTSRNFPTGNFNQ